MISLMTLALKIYNQYVLVNTLFSTQVYTDLYTQHVADTVNKNFIIYKNWFSCVFPQMYNF